MTSVAEILADRKICICAGSGGVGKTTTSAAIASGLAARGMKVAVLTIDPAKRLADSLGLEELGNEPRKVDPALFTEAGVEMKGELWAMMLDSKATFDELVERNAPDEAARDRILENRIYRQISNALAGSQEYMAMEKLYEIHQSGDYDFLVLDTPPSRNALEFLDAPKRLTQFIEGRSLQIFMRPTGLATSLIGRGSAVMFQVLKRILGFDLLSDIGEFLQAFSGMVDGFSERARSVAGLLADPATSFIVVCGPQGEPIEEAIYFQRKLLEAEMPVGGIIVNKVHYEIDGGEGVEQTMTDQLGVDSDLAARVSANFDNYRALATRDAENISRLSRDLNAQTVIRVPYFDEDVHDLGGLLKIDGYLFASGDERERMAAS
ncbi:MAG: ArsA family ATPase [bacterium]